MEARAARGLRVNLPGRPYRVEVGPGLLADAGPRIARVARGNRLLLVADRNALRYHGAGLLRSLRGHFEVCVVTIPPGEKSKSLDRASRIYDECRRHELARQDLIVAFGGGVTGDLAGYVAATWLRGVDLIMIPTTLLSQVDSSVGGKVGVNYRGIKNQVGAFHQPRLVLSDTQCLATLPAREVRSGLAEVVKSAMIASPPLFRRIERHVEEILHGDSRVLADLVLECSRIKARVVERDETESGVRAVLNYGHTIGHALESAAKGRLRHGEAVALGMRAAAHISSEMGWITQSDRDRQDSLLDILGLPARVSGVKIADVMAKIKWDKKVRGRSPRFVLTPRIGSATLAPPVRPSLIRSAVEGLLIEKALRRK